MSAWISILGLYNVYPDIFDDLILPRPEDVANDRIEYIDPIEPLDKDLLINHILMELAELGLVYSDPVVLRHMIGIWSRVEKSNWLGLWETLLYKYNPIWNKDGTIVEDRGVERRGEKSGSRTNSHTVTDTGTITDAHEGGVENTISNTGTITDDGSRESSGSSSNQKSVDHNVTGYDTNAYSPNTQDVEDGNTTTTESGSQDNIRSLDTRQQINGEDSATDVRTLNTSKATEGSESEAETTSGTESEQYHRREFGNIGVTMTQDMIAKQREIVRFNMYRYITESFKERFCIMVY